LGLKINQLKPFQMKNYITLLLIVPTFILFTACGGGKNNSTADNKLGKLEVEIPKELEGNKEVVAFIEGMAEVSDDYAIMIDETLEKTGEFIGKESEELSMMEQLKLVKVTGEIAIKSATIMEKWGTFMDQRTSLEEQLSDDEVKALETVFKRFEQRFDQIEEKHSKVLSQSSAE